MKVARGGRLIEWLAGAPSRGGGGDGERVPTRWHTQRTADDPWARDVAVDDIRWLRDARAQAVRNGLQHGLLFPLTRALARPRVRGADDLLHAPQPAVIAANHSSDIDTPLILAALPQPWRSRTVVGAAADRFYRNRRSALMTALWINTFPFDRGDDLRGLADSAKLINEGYNLLLYPQATRKPGLGGFRTGVARLCIATDAPLLPVHVSGSATIMPRDRGLTQRGRATVTFGRPLHPMPGEEPRAFADRARDAVVALAARR